MLTSRAFERGWTPYGPDVRAIYFLCPVPSLDESIDRILED
jgi:hypothetical protein